MVSKANVAEVKELTKIISSKPVVGVVDITRIPAPAIQKMRKAMREHTILVRSSKNSLLEHALIEVAKGTAGLDGLKQYIGGQAAVVISSENPFKLWKSLNSTKSKSPAKGGEIAPEDIMVKAGDTPFKPGPVVSELQKVGIPAAIEKSKVVIKSDKVLVKKGEKISRDIALALTKLEIYPLTIGLDLKAAFAEGMVYPGDVLVVDDVVFAGKIGLASAQALALAMGTGYMTPETVPPLMQRAYRQCVHLAVKAEITTPETVAPLIQQAYAQMTAIAAPAAQEAKPAEKKEEKKEEKVEEEATAGLGALFG
ncbi:MAG: 50S ribosomal protein L10 [Candidatus Thermoplasmatota archaeon]|nr:50S ribosomal protein L10 [Candidatus Thermoplasmatota archaeon]